MKKFRHLYPNVLSWDDSAGREAFDNAWRRFWYKKKGYACDTPLPDPDLYIDIIDWDAEVDPELWRDLESIPVVSHTEEEDKAPVGDLSVPNYQEITPTGWGDDVEKIDPEPVYTPHDLRGHGWGSPAWPYYVSPSVGPAFVWQYPTPGGGWSYAYNYVGPYGLWGYNNVGTSSARPLESSYMTQTWKNDGGWYTRRQSAHQPQGRPMHRRQAGDQPQGRRMQSK